MLIAVLAVGALSNLCVLGIVLLLLTILYLFSSQSEIETGKKRWLSFHIEEGQELTRELFEELIIDQLS